MKPLYPNPPSVVCEIDSLTNTYLQTIDVSHEAQDQSDLPSSLAATNR
jgi:hypothetical protein